MDCSRPLARVLLGTAAAVALVSCSAQEPAPGDAAASGAPATASPTSSGGSPATAPATSPAASSTPSTTASATASATESATASASPSPRPKLPDAADGGNRRSCADGRCEIRVKRKAQIPLPVRYGIGPIQVTGVNSRTVTMFAPLTGSNFSKGAGCSASITGPSQGAPGYVILDCSVGMKTVINKMRLEVLGAVGKTAVIRIRPAK
ncbi:hypothetical protein GCM10009733_042420 [Nonomuraea maheshkhaliensis]|uniref:Uncharacterized protein n=1 Tax=Nonomuraea maheshkhaliensis TaxID=419590 RepID=A0ABP4RD07_9ACTN